MRSRTHLVENAAGGLCSQQGHALLPETEHPIREMYAVGVSVSALETLLCNA